MGGVGQMRGVDSVVGDETMAEEEGALDGRSTGWRCRSRRSSWTAVGRTGLRKRRWTASLLSTGSVRASSTAVVASESSF